MIARLRNYLFEQEDNSPIILFRILFGFLAFCEVVGAIFTGWVHETFIEPQYHLPFIGFEWISLPSDATIVYSYYALMALAALGIMLGAYYRIATLAFALLWWGSYLMQKVHYNNHYYLIILLAFFMFVIPANRYASWDVKRNPHLRQYTCSRWCSRIFIIQVCIVFTFAAIAKINPDWLAGKPIEVWFATKTHYRIIGSLFAAEWFRGLVTYGGIAFDLLISPLLLWRRTRTAAFIACIGFNLFNSFTFQIGGFPYLMIALTLFFFPKEVIRKRFFKRKPTANIPEPAPELRHAPLIMAALSIYFVIQIILPLRHILIPGSVLWTEEGHRMAWHMMLRAKSGHISFHGKVPETNRHIEINLHDYFTPLQCRQIAKYPDMTWQAAQVLKKIYAQKGYPTIALYATGEVSLNGGPWKPLIDPETDLAHTPWLPFSHASWIPDYD